MGISPLFPLVHHTEVRAEKASFTTCVTNHMSGPRQASEAPLAGEPLDVSMRQRDVNASDVPLPGDLDHVIQSPNPTFDRLKISADSCLQASVDGIAPIGKIAVPAGLAIIAVFWAKIRQHEAATLADMTCGEDSREIRLHVVLTTDHNHHLPLDVACRTPEASPIIPGVIPRRRTAIFSDPGIYVSAPADSISDDRLVSELYPKYSSVCLQIFSPRSLADLQSTKPCPL
jgi:hypothetical protein